MSTNYQPAAPPAPLKQYTDEELKQKYGIHLATRLESEETTEQKAKWADEDEDEEEWTPETVEWMDGTKSSVNHADAVPPPPPAQPQEKVAEKTLPPPPQSQIQHDSPMPPPAKPIITAPKRTTLAVQSRTILRPGAAQQAKQIGADGKATPNSKSPMLKNTLPAPIKSPWASLPPVEKASPVTINPPSVTQPSPRFAHRDPHGFDSLTSQPLPAREMATDTFDRSWKEGDRSNRELFNSQSGRYEPAPEHRRGSRQQEYSHRQPAVLQRPSGGAEPSAAFQARTNSQTDGSPWARRRGSSISGNAPPRDRRMSSSSKVFDEASPEAAPETKTEAQTSAEAPEAQIHQTDGPAPSALSITEEREKQKKLMQEKREAAIRRRQEEEAREEAERRERIRKKMEALGMPLEKTPSQDKTSKTEKKQQPEAARKEVSTVVPSAIVAADASPEKLPAAEAAVPSVDEQVRTQAPPLSPQPVQSLSPRKDKTIDSALSFSQNPTPISRPAHKALPSPQLPGLQQHSPNGPARSPYQQSSLQGITASSFPSPSDQKSQPARLPSISSGDSFTTTPWGSASMTSHNAPNLWGPPPSNNRHIGNGTFDAGYSSISPNSRAQTQNAPFAAPFASRPYPHQRVSPKAFGQSASAQSGTMDQQYGPLSTLDARVPESPGASALVGTSPLPEPARLAYPTPIAPPQKSAPRQQNMRDTSAWTNFSNDAQAARAEAQTAARSHNDREQPSAPQHARHAKANWTVEETFIQTRRGQDHWLEDGSPTRVLPKSQDTVRGAVPPGPHRAGVIGAIPPGPHRAAAAAAGVVRPGPHRTTRIMPGPQSPIAQQSMNHAPPPGGEQLHMAGAGIVRLPTGPSGLSSGFDSPGNATTGVRLPPLTAYAGNAQSLPAQPSTPGSAPQQSRFFPSALYGGSPPPEEFDHPVHGGDSKHPHVNLPAPKAKVKLPPAATTERQPESPVTMPRSVQSFTVGAKPLVQTQDWQARFNGLFGKAQVITSTPPSPPKTPPKMQAPAPAVAPASRTNLDSIVEQRAATVSLPRSSSPVSLVLKTMSKPSVDDMFDGELSFGSTPRVFLPRGVVYPDLSSAANTPLRLNSRFPKPVECQSKTIIFFPDNTTRDITIQVKLPLPWFVARPVTLPRKFKDTQGNKNSGKPSSSSRNKLDVSSDEHGSSSTTPYAAKDISAKSQDVPIANLTSADDASLSQMNTENMGPKKSNWPKVAKGPKTPRGRGRGGYRALD
jgi:hypothetical protein